MRMIIIVCIWIENKLFLLFIYLFIYLFHLQYLPELRRRFRLRPRFEEAAAWKLSMAAAKMDQRRGGPGDLASDQITWVSVHVRRCALNHSHVFPMTGKEQTLLIWSLSDWQCCGTGTATAGTGTSCLSGTGTSTGMHSESDSGSGPGFGS